jgi:hypothetical protein
MKFIVFNIVVAVALIYLVANKDNGVDVSLPKFGDVTAAAGQVLDRTPAAEPQSPAVPPAPKPANPFSIINETKIAAAAPAPFVDAPVIDASDLVPPYLGTQVAAAPVIDAADLKPPQPLETAVARRRAEILGEGPATSPKPVRPATERRRQLLDLAEEMEYLAAKFSVQ